MNAFFDPAVVAAEAVARNSASDEPIPVDLAVLNQHRRKPPDFPCEVLGPAWAEWGANAAAAAAAPVDYVVASLLAAASALIGNARWAQATPGWSEPPHLWVGVVGDSGSGKSPATDAIFGRVLPVLERRMAGDFPVRQREHRARAEAAKVRAEAWQKDVRAARSKDGPPPLPPADMDPGPEPLMPTLKSSDVTIEKMATLLARAAPKGILLVRDELDGWVCGMTTYNPAGRAFWIESYGGRPYRVERQKEARPIDIPHLAIACFGGTQPEKIARTMREADDGLLARFVWFWPEPTRFALSTTPPGVEWATEALDRLRLLEMITAGAGEPAKPVMVQLDDGACLQIERFGQSMQERQQHAGGLMRSAFGKLRGLALRLSLVLEYLWWCAKDGTDAPPTSISVAAFTAATRLVESYFIPMAERVYGDAACGKADRNAATLARWIARERPIDVHIRTLQREVRLPGLADAQSLHEAAAVLVDAGWLVPPRAGTFQQRGRAAYPINPALWEALAASASETSTS